MGTFLEFVARRALLGLLRWDRVRAARFTGWAAAEVASGSEWQVWTRERAEHRRSGT